MGIALGLGAALSWGLADYFAALASRSAGVLRVVLGFHLAALVPLAVLVFATGALAPVKLDQLPVFVLSPVVSGYAAVTVVLAVLISSERLSPAEITAVAVTIAGAMVASADVREIGRAKLERRSALGFLLALAAMALLGGFVFGVSYYHRSIGWLGPIFLARAATALFLIAHASASEGLHRRLFPRELLPAVILLAVLDTSGYVFFNVGVRHAATWIVAAASAPYALVPILMGVSLLRERPTPVQWSGVALVIGGLITLGLAG